MNEDEQVAICRSLATVSMWGHGWVGPSVVDRLDRGGPAGPRPWREVYAENVNAAQRASAGVIDDRAVLRSYLARGYHLTNFDVDGCALFNPPPMNGLSQYVSKELAAEYRTRDRTTTVEWPAT